jgi:serine/threonine protein kinase
MSPELINEKQYDTKSDIWSLGCLIYELCAQKYEKFFFLSRQRSNMLLVHRFMKLRHTKSLLFQYDKVEYRPSLGFTRRL